MCNYAQPEITLMRFAVLAVALALLCVAASAAAYEPLDAAQLSVNDQTTLTDSDDMSPLHGGR